MQLRSGLHQFGACCPADKRLCHAECSSQQLAFLMLQTQQRVETRHDVMRSDPAGFCLSCSGAANKIDVENMSAVLIFMVTSHPQVAQFAHNLTPHLDFVQR